MNFKKGVGGDFTCQQYPDYRYSKTGIVSNIKQGEGNCPCSVTKFAYDSSNCAGTLSGESCGGKYERCDKIDNCAEYDANRTQCTKCNAGYNLENGQCVEDAGGECAAKIKSLGSNYYPITSGDQLASNDDPDKYKATDVLVLMNDISVNFAQINSNVEPASKYCSNVPKSKLIGAGAGLGFKPTGNIQISVPVETANSMVLGNTTFNETYKAQQLTISGLGGFSDNVTVTFKKPANIDTLNVLDGTGTITFEDTLTVGNMETYDNDVVFKKGVTYK